MQINVWGHRNYMRTYIELIPAIDQNLLSFLLQVVAKSRFWYFLHQMHKMKKTTGEILDVNEVSEAPCFSPVVVAASSPVTSAVRAQATN